MEGRDFVGAIFLMGQSRPDKHTLFICLSSMPPLPARLKKSALDRPYFRLRTKGVIGAYPWKGWVTRRKHRNRR